MVLCSPAAVILTHLPPPEDLTHTPDYNILSEHKQALATVCAGFVVRIKQNHRIQLSVSLCLRTILHRRLTVSQLFREWLSTEEYTTVKWRQLLIISSVTRLADNHGHFRHVEHRVDVSSLVLQAHGHGVLPWICGCCLSHARWLRDKPTHHKSRPLQCTLHMCRG